jgi:hypothetical protein
MTIVTEDGLVDALANNSQRIIIDKSSIGNLVAGQFASLWRATGQPAQGAIPTTAVVPTSGTTGAMGFTNPTAPIRSYIGYMFANCSNSAMSFEVHDRVAHQAALVLNLTTSQTTNLPIDLSSGFLNLAAARRGDANYSDIQWWLEVYSDGGATASNATINVTYDDGSTGNLNALAVGGTLRAGRLIPLTPLIPTAQQGKFIRGVNSVILSASTTVAGNFGFTATRPRTVLDLPLANKTERFTWAELGLPEVADNACLMLLALTSTTSTGTLRGGGKIPQG